MRHCQDCNRSYSDKYFRAHCRSNNHFKKTFGVKYIYKKENILVNGINNTLSNIIKKHKRKFHSFYIVCKINNKKIMLSLIFIQIKKICRLTTIYHNLNLC